ncbi:MAG: HK97-gp10 family putative phage morphogenesis protein [Caldilineaceae bacterium]
MAYAVALRGGEQIVEKLKQMERATRNEELRTALAEGGEIILAAAQAMAPVKDGDLKASLYVDTASSKAQVQIKSDLIYAPIIEFGWPDHNIEPQPFMRPALDENTDAVRAAMEEQLKRNMGL